MRPALLLAAWIASGSSYASRAVQSVPDSLLFHRHTLPLSSGQCTAGGPALLYSRNCTANWDSHSGFDYCPKGGPADPVRFIIVLASEDVRPLTNSEGPPESLAWDGSGLYCYSAASCASRSANLTSTTGLPPTAFFGGVLSPFAEVNPNFYKASMALLPYCSSDLWAGTASTPSGLHFHGQRIALAALAALAALPGRESLRAADEVVLIGPPGVVALAALATPYLSQHAALTVLCEGCALLPSPPAMEAQAAPPQCTTDANCPPHLALPLAVGLWGTPHPASTCPPPTPTWQCLTTPAILAVPWSTPASPTLLLAAQGRDARAAAAYGPGLPPSALAAALQAAGRAAVGAGGGVLARQGSGLFLSHTCASPSALALHPAAFYGQQLDYCSNGAGQARNQTLAQVLSAGVGCREVGTPAAFCATCYAWEAGSSEACAA